jgi:hypothetical protein
MKQAQVKIKFRSMIAFRLLLIAIILGGIIIDSAAQTVRKTEPFKVIGYVPSWTGTADDIQYEKLTHLYYMAVRPTTTGELTAPDNIAKLKQIVSRAHDKGLKAGIVIGGWSDLKNDDFHQMAANTSVRAKFVGNVLSLVAKHNLDGVDLDWKYPAAGEDATNFAALIHELAVALHGKGKFLSAVVAANGKHAEAVQTSVMGDADFLNLSMEANPGLDNVTLAYASASVEYWLKRGLPTSKAVLGIPMSSPGTWKSFRTLVSEGANPNMDNYAGDAYNGTYTVKQKTTMAFDRQLSGIILSELSQDMTDKHSLLLAAYSVVQERDAKKISILRPFQGTRHIIPGVIEAEQYDDGGEGIAYHDLSPANAGGTFRTDNVDIEAIAEKADQYKLAGIEAGEWLNYSVQVASAGVYNLEVEVASVAAGNTFHIELDGKNISGTITVPGTGDWTTWKTVSINTTPLSKGKKVLRLVIDKGNNFAINAISFKQNGATDTSTEAVSKEESSDFSKQTLSLYPNPGLANSEQVVRLTVGTDAQKAFVRVKNLNGLESFRQQYDGVTGGSIEVHLPSLARGLYIVSVETENGTWTEKYLVR